MPIHDTIIHNNIHNIEEKSWTQNWKKREEFTENAGFIKDMLKLDSAALTENLTSAEDLKREFTAS